MGAGLLAVSFVIPWHRDRGRAHAVVVAVA
jgi:hypothetical protein